MATYFQQLLSSIRQSLPLLLVSAKVDVKEMGKLEDDVVDDTSIVIPAEANCLNAQNRIQGFPKTSDVVVVGAGIHSLIFAIHARTLELKNNPTASPTSITILEKSSSPGYKIGESTLTVFGVWLKLIGIDSPMLWRIFGPKDGLAFYYFNDKGDPEDYSTFVANGPAADFVATLQVERKISELMLTLYAQRLGITVLHGTEVIVDEETLGRGEEETKVKVLNTATKEEKSVNARLLIDASGRFHRFVSKSKQRIERPEGFNTHAFWAYWDCNVDEKEIPLRDYESVNTNHICIPEGWAWVIKLPTWEGTPLHNLIAMLNHLLDLNFAKTPADAYPSTAALITKFNLTFRWVTSIGFALRSDVIYPPNLHTYGSCEASQKFNYVVSKYSKVSSFMSKFTLIPNLYGPGTTWYTRKNLAFRSPSVSGENWMAVGDATGFTNPLYSPGINANMGTSIFVAENVREYLASDKKGKREMREKYEVFCRERIPNLQRMNVFNYSLFRGSELGPLGPLWQYLIGTGNERFQASKTYGLDNCAELLTTWDWGANDESYIVCADKVNALLARPAHEPVSVEVVEKVKTVVKKAIEDAVVTGKFKGRWSGLLRYYDDDLVFRGYEGKRDRDVLARRCDGCGEWRMLRPDCCRCPFCGWEHSLKDSTKVIYGL
ncbi:hypothetical protein VTL71DRAFT_10416 [Oculimacula yallundae]|uniref:FAD/NAD(P)-binding domain-containing protein n=1 Tax=Oculimacula yallundae TaxID=86028 RepID=A0ABR4CTH3_9HELO